MWDEAIFVDWSASFKKGKFKPREKKVEIGRHERLGEVFGKRNSWEHNLKIRIMPRWLREGVHVYVGELRKEFVGVEVRESLQFIIEYCDR